jgi:hypothetical protein
MITSLPATCHASSCFRKSLASGKAPDIRNGRRVNEQGVALWQFPVKERMQGRDDASARDKPCKHLSSKTKHSLPMHFNDPIEKASKKMR